MIAYLRSKLVPDRPTVASVHGRAELDRIAPTVPARALALARAIPDAWYRAQALSCVAQHVRESSVGSIVGEAIAAAHDCSDAYNTVAVMSWPLQAAWSQGTDGVSRVQPAVGVDPGSVVRQDGSSVDIDVEAAAQAKNGLQYGAISQVLKSRISILRSAMGVA